MATSSFTRKIIISDPTAIEKLKNLDTLDDYKVDELIYRNRKILSKKTSKETITRILQKY